MAAPTDGYGVYESLSPDNIATSQAHLRAIAASGFRLVMNYGLLSSTAANITSYINFAASVGLKVIVSLENPAIWRDNTIAATFPELYADSGNQGTDSSFTTYVVNLVKGLAGTWGYYVGDEPLTVDHAALLAHCNIVHSADAVKPRLLIEGAERASNAVYTNNSPFFDCCEVTGDDYYPVGNTLITWPIAATVAAGIQATCAAHSNQSAMVLQATSLAQYSRQTCAPWSGCATWPTYGQMRTTRDAALANMAPRLILWYSYFDVIAAPATFQQWNTLTLASNDIDLNPNKTPIGGVSGQYVGKFFQGMVGG